MRTEEEIRKKIAELELYDERLMKMALKGGLSWGSFVCFSARGIDRIKIRVLKWVLGEGELT